MPVLGSQTYFYIRQEGKWIPMSEARKKQEGGTHYKEMKIEPWDVIDTWPKEQQIGFYRGNALKYTMRYKSKGGLTDLKKAQHYLEKLIEIEGKKENIAYTTENNGFAYQWLAPPPYIKVKEPKFQVGQYVIYKGNQCLGCIHENVIGTHNFYSVILDNAQRTIVKAHQSYFTLAKDPRPIYLKTPISEPKFKVGDKVEYRYSTVDWIYNGLLCEVTKVSYNPEKYEWRVEAICVYGILSASEINFIPRTH